MVTHQDVVTSIFGASAGLGGLMLVFLGMVIGVYQSLPPGAPPAVKARVRAAAWRVFAVFVTSIASTAFALLWLAIPGDDSLYWANIAVFSADLAAIVTVAALTTKRLL